MASKQLGKIVNVKFGHIGYQQAIMGLSLTLNGGGFFVNTEIVGGWSSSVKCDKHSEWTEEDRNIERVKMVCEIDELLQKAKVDDVMKLVGKPVEMTSEGMKLVSWRILEEVL